MRRREKPLLTTIFAAPATITKGAAPAPFSSVMSTSTFPLIGTSFAADAVTRRLMVAICTEAPFALEDAVEPTMRTFDGGLPRVHEKRYPPQLAPAAQPVAVRTDASMDTMIWKLRRLPLPVLIVTGTESVSPFATGGKGAPPVAPRSTSNACAWRLPNTSAEEETAGVHTVEKVTLAGR